MRARDLRRAWRRATPSSPRCGPRSARARVGAAAKIRRHQRLLRRLHARLRRRGAPQADHRARTTSRQEAGQNALGLFGARAEAVRVGRRENVLLPPAGQTGDRGKPAARRSGHHADAVSRGKGQSHPRFHPLAHRCPLGNARRQPGAQVRAKSPATGLRLAGPRRRPGQPRDPRPGDGGCAGRQIDFFLYKSEGERRTGR